MNGMEDVGELLQMWEMSDIFNHQHQKRSLYTQLDVKLSEEFSFTGEGNVMTSRVP